MTDINFERLRKVKQYAEAHEISFDELMDTIHNKKPQIHDRKEHTYNIGIINCVYGVYYLLSADHTIMHKTRRLNITYECSLAKPSTETIKSIYEGHRKAPCL